MALLLSKHKTKRRFLEELLPRDFKYIVEVFELIEDSEIVSEAKFHAIIKLDITTEEEFQAFFAEFSGISNTSYNHLKDNRNGKTVALSGRKKCIHQVRKVPREDGTERKDHVKDRNTSCESIIRYKLLRSSHSKACSFYNCEVELMYQHNHSVVSADALKHQKVSSETKEEFLKLFAAGHSASSSYSLYKQMLEEKHGNDYIRVAANASLCPSYRWVFYQKEIYMKANYGNRNCPSTVQMAQEKITKYNETHGAELCKMRQKENGDFIIVCTDPMARRVHECLPSSGDIVLVDATSNLDNCDTKFFRFLTSSPLGGIPLGFIICSNEQEELVTEAFEMFKQILPPYAFYKRGPEKGPSLFLSDDSRAEINSLR